MRNVFLLMASFFILTSLSYAYSLQELNSTLYSYNVSPSLLKTLTYINITYNGDTYVALYKGSTPNLYFLINTTSSGFSFITDYNEIALLTNNETLTIALNQSRPVMNSLPALLGSYLNSSASTLNDCVIETGLNRGFTCTVENNCQSCLFVPNCNRVLYATNGPSGVFGEGIISFEASYNLLLASESTFHTSIANITASNANSFRNKINSAISTIILTTGNFSNNPIFPAPSSANFGLCGTAAGASTSNLSTTTGPSYCNALGYCEALTYNTTLSSRLSSAISEFNNAPFSNQQLLTLANNASSFENQYVIPTVRKEKLAALNKFLTSNLSDYNTTVSASALLLSHTYNSLLSASLSALQSNYTYIEENYLSANLNAYNRSLYNGLKNLTVIYNQANATYAAILAKAKYNTASLMAIQLESPAAIIPINFSYEELSLNNMIASRIDNTTAISSNLSRISAAAESYIGPTISLVGVARVVDGPFAVLMGKALSLSYSSGMGLAVIFSVILSLIISAIVFIIFYYLYYNLKRTKRLLINNKTKRNWNSLFIILVAGIITYLILTYLFASAASSSPSISAFSGSLSASKSVVIAVNGNASSALSNCASKIADSVNALGKTPIMANITSSACTVNGKKSTSCISPYFYNDTPVVILSHGVYPEMKMYSFYGTMLSVSGNSNFMSLCNANAFIR